MQDHAFVQDFAIQIPWWAGVLIIVAIVFGVCTSFVFHLLGPDLVHSGRP